MRWKLAVGGGNGGQEKKNGGHDERRNDIQNNAEYPRNNSGKNDHMPNDGVGNERNGNNRQNGGHMNMPSMPYPHMPQRSYMPHAFYPQPEVQPSAMDMGYYAQNMIGDMMPSGHRPSYAPQNRQMGFVLTDPMEEDGKEDYTEAMRRRSRRTGRFIRGESDNEISAHYGRRRRSDDDGFEEDEESGGSYRRSGKESDGEMRRLTEKIKRMEKRLEEGEDAQEHIRHLKKEVKRLTEALDELKEEKGESGKDREKSEKKKKEHGKDDDDEEDDPVAGLKKLLKEGVEGKEFLKHLPAIFQAVFEVIATPPKTWPSYLEKGDYSGIYAMEAKELMKAIEQYKSGQVDVNAVVKEIKHTGAALIQLYAHLLHQLEQRK